MVLLDPIPFRRDKYIYFLTIASILVHFALHRIFGTPFLSNIYLAFTFKAFALTGVLGLIAYFFVLIYQKEKSPLKKYFELFTYPLRNPSEAINFILMLTAISFVLSVYSSTKDAIPFLIPYYADPLLIAIEEKIHFGYQPWEITHSIFSTSLATGVINLFYNLWFFFCWIFLIYFCMATHKAHIRQQAIISFIACWLLIGGLLATLLSSVGPCYYGYLYDQSPLFDPLMDLLTSQNNKLQAQDSFLGVWALKTQDALWESYISETSNFGSGISAMPSMHVSMATLMALSLSALNRKLGVLGWLYVFVILIGSVHLGWHYALDGYLSIPLTVAIWYAVKNLSQSTRPIEEPKKKITQALYNIKS